MVEFGNIVKSNYKLLQGLFWTPEYQEDHGLICADRSIVWKNGTNWWRVDGRYFQPEFQNFVFVSHVGGAEYLGSFENGSTKVKFTFNVNDGVLKADDGSVGHFEADGTINWGHVKWNRAAHDINGTYHHNEHFSAFQLTHVSGGKFSASSNGWSADVTFDGIQLHCDVITGTITRDGNIKWSNGAIWTNIAGHYKHRQHNWIIATHKVERGGTHLSCQLPGATVFDAVYENGRFKIASENEDVIMGSDGSLAFTAAHWDRVHF